MFRVMVEPETLTKRSNIIGLIHFRFGDTAFPDARWDDFAVIILGWWSQAALRLLGGVSQTEELLFMDGPYSVTVEREGETLRASAVKGLETGVPGLCEAASPEEVARTVLEAAEAVLVACGHHGWSGTDMESLNHHATALRAALSVQ